MRRCTDSGVSKGVYLLWHTNFAEQSVVCYTCTPPRSPLLRPLKCETTRLTSPKQESPCGAKVSKGCERQFSCSHFGNG